MCLSTCSGLNDAALALIQNGSVDWTHNFVPNVEKAYEAKDGALPRLYSNADYPISLVFDNTQYPYSPPAFRKALSLAIDRVTVWNSVSTATSHRPTHSG